jgi:hypothetical protein
MGIMRDRFGLLPWLLALVFLAAPAVSHAQNWGYEVPPPDPLYPIPLGGPRYEDGGIWLNIGTLLYRQTNPLKGQVVARRGFLQTAEDFGFRGSLAVALDVNQISGPVPYQPGWTIGLGWRFQDGATIAVNWKHLTDVRYSATASILPPNFNIGVDGEDTFISSPVFNFPPDYAGPSGDRQDIGGLPPGAAFGIWNGADIMTIDFIQRYDEVTIGGRIPMEMTECWRMYGLLGVKAVVMFERFKWRTIDQDIEGLAGPADFANYINVTSQRMYGFNFGIGNDWLLADTPIGAFSMTLDLQAALLLNLVKQRAKYELGTLSTAGSRARNTYTFVPEVEANLAFMWYPTQGISIRAGWDVTAFFNTVASPRPIDFNYGAIDPTWEQWVTRTFNGLHIGVSFVF